MRRGSVKKATHRGAALSSRASAGPLRDEPLVAIVSSSSGGLIFPVPERSPSRVSRGAWHALIKRIEAYGIGRPRK